MTYCNKCGGTGHGANNKFCTCVDGKLLKQMADARAKADKLKAEKEQEERRQAAQKKIDDTKAKINKIIKANEIDLEKMVEDNLNEFPYNLGDWVVVKGVVGTISNIDGAARKAKIIGHYYEGSRKPFDGSHGWTDFGKVEPAPLETFDGVSITQLIVEIERDMNINRALDTRNEKLFREWLESE